MPYTSASICSSLSQTHRPQQDRYNDMMTWRNLLVFACVSALALFSATASKSFAGREDSEQNRVAEREMMAKLGRDMSRNLRNSVGKDAQMPETAGKTLKHARKDEQARAQQRLPPTKEHTNSVAQMHQVVKEFSKLDRKNSLGATNHHERASELHGAQAAQQRLPQLRESNALPMKPTPHQNMQAVAREFSHNLSNRAAGPQHAAPPTAGATHGVKSAHHMKRGTDHPQKFQQDHIKNAAQNLAKSTHHMLSVPGQARAHRHVENHDEN